MTSRGIVGASGDAGIPAKRALADAELAQIELSDTEIADNVGTVMLSVVRDMAISSFYGKAWAVEFAAGEVPPLDQVLSAEFACLVGQELRALGPVQHLNFPLYGSTGDALGMLARLLVCCRDVKQLEPFVKLADERIASMAIEVDHMADSRFVHHLRNAVLHSRFKVEVDTQDPFNSRFVFLDINPRTKELTAKIVLTNNQLVELMRIIIHDVFEAYLGNLPNGMKWVVA